MQYINNAVLGLGHTGYLDIAIYPDLDLFAEIEKL